MSRQLGTAYIELLEANGFTVRSIGASTKRAWNCPDYRGHDINISFFDDPLWVMSFRRHTMRLHGGTVEELRTVLNAIVADRKS